MALASLTHAGSTGHQHLYLRIDNLASIEVQKPKDLEKLRADEREAMRKAEEAERAEGEKKKVIP